MKIEKQTMIKFTEDELDKLKPKYTVGTVLSIKRDVASFLPYINGYDTKDYAISQLEKGIKRIEMANKYLIEYVKLLEKVKKVE